jgi:hypothetical protein
MMVTNLVSNCCNASLQAVFTNEGIGYYECFRCGRPADGHAIVEETNNPNKDGIPNDTGNAQ